ncbi:hypothetical protein ACN08Y_10210 [Rothia sp. P5764]|uniref:hypothetical protein n=1 Tax=Rothia sp. P5764 TaxID=3402654 RepID=UPI003AC0A21B
MAKTVKLTGAFLTTEGTPLAGRVIVGPAPAMVVAPDEDVIYAGPTVLPLDDKGKIEGEIIATEGWAYEAVFELKTTDGRCVPQRNAYFQLTADADLSDILEAQIQNGTRRPVLTYSSYLPGEITAAGATPDPEDTGAILVPVASA